MRRRKYIAALGSAAAGGSFIMGTGASIDVWATRNADITATTDTDAFLRLAPGDENGQFVSTDGGTLSIDFSDASGQGFNTDARSTVDDLFRIENQTGDTQVVWIKDADEGGPKGDIRGPINFFRGPVKATGGSQFRIVSAIEPVPGTGPKQQRLSITGLVPPSRSGGGGSDGPELDFNPLELWVRTGNPVKTGNGVTFDPRADVPYTDGQATPGSFGGRLVLGPGENMKVGVDIDYTKNDPNIDDTKQGIDEIQIVSRKVSDALNLATSNTEFSNQ